MKRLRVVPLPGAARIGVRALQRERLAVVLDLRALSVGEVAIIRIKPGLDRADQRPAGQPERRQALAHLEADDRLAKAIGRQQPFGALVLFGDEAVDAVIPRRRVSRAVAVITDDQRRTSRKR